MNFVFNALAVDEEDTINCFIEQKSTNRFLGQIIFVVVWIIG